MNHSHNFDGGFLHNSIEAELCESIITTKPKSDILDEDPCTQVVPLPSEERKDTSPEGGRTVRKASWPTFTNEVIVIRPQMFYENKDCQEDNKFMKESGL